jgi:phosphoribosyl-AMP cyclohydrolase
LTIYRIKLISSILSQLLGATRQSMKVKSIYDIDFAKRKGLLPVIVQDRNTKDILMLAYANEEAVRYTIRTGNACFWSTTRNKLWMKGEESGDVQPVKEIFLDCDLDALLYQVESENPACHTGHRSCFHNTLQII